jgi:NAD(P) transhydrogenase subunit alpha
MKMAARRSTPITASASTAARARRPPAVDAKALILAARDKLGRFGMNKLDLLFFFMLATFLGMDIIRRVSRLLHTPLMALTNAISSIAVIGAIVLAGENKDTLTTVLGATAVFASTTNLVSGYLITQRMLAMFKKRESK